MCGGSNGSCDKSSQCCVDLLKLYCKIYELYLRCPPVTGSNVTLACLQARLTMIVNPIFARIQCGRLFCCEGYADTIYCAFQAAISELSALTQPVVPADVTDIISGLQITLQAIATQAGFMTPLNFASVPCP